MPEDRVDSESALIEVMAWCRQASSHYLNQCWPIYPTPYGVIDPQWFHCLRKYKEITFLSSSARVIEIISHRRQRSIYNTQLKAWTQVAWWCNELVYKQSRSPGPFCHSQHGLPVNVSPLRSCYLLVLSIDVTIEAHFDIQMPSYQYTDSHYGLSIHDGPIPTIGIIIMAWRQPHIQIC